MRCYLLNRCQPCWSRREIVYDEPLNGPPADKANVPGEKTSADHLYCGCKTQRIASHWCLMEVEMCVSCDV